MFHDAPRHRRECSQLASQRAPDSSRGRGRGPDRSLRKARRDVPTPLRTLPKSLEMDLVCDFLEFLDSPRALAVWLLYRSGEHRQLVELSIDPLQYENPDEFRRDYQATRLLAKHDGLSTGIDTTAVAMSAFSKAEEQCRTTNQRLRDLRSGACASGPEASIFHRARAKIAAILGDVSDLCLTAWDPGWSKGRTSSAYGSSLSSARKYASRLDVTPRARTLALRMLRSTPAWGAAALKADAPCSVLGTALNVVEGNTLLVVPKNAKTGRPICYEPHVNIRLQLAVGSYIRQRLHRVGVKLDDQSVNQRRARVGSKHGHLATIDLSSASDTIATELVWELLPYDWAALLDDLRSHYTRYPDGSVKNNEKFSSMGNGFTFELESLIFFAVSSAVSDDVSVYGDDIVCPTQSFESVSHALELCGFTLNRAKSFSQGHFRESCGADVFRGLDVTPAYLRTSLRKHRDAVRFFNQVYAWASRTFTGERALLDLLEKWRQLIGGPSGPAGYGDGHLFIDWDAAAPSRPSGKRASWDGWSYSTWVALPITDQDFRDGLVSEGLAYAMLSSSLGPKRPKSLYDSEVIRGSVRYVKITSVAPSWPSVTWI